MSEPTSALVSAGGVVVFLGLAILGWGGFDAFFANPARIALVVATAAMVVAGLFSPGTSASVSVRIVPTAGSLAHWAWSDFSSAWLPAYTDRKEFWVLDGEAVRWLGVALYAGGGALRLWPVFVLGRRSSGLVAIQPGHTLVTDGLYSGHSQSQLSRAARPVARLGAGLSLGRGRAAGGAEHSTAGRAHERGGEVAALAVRPAIRGLLRAHVAAAAWKRN